MSTKGGCQASFLSWSHDLEARYASLFFVACIDKEDNELITLEMIHLFVEVCQSCEVDDDLNSSLDQVLDRYFGNVCELDIIFNFHKVSTPRIVMYALTARMQAYYILDELFINGELQESSKKEVLSVCAQMDEMMDEAKEDAPATGKSTSRRS